MNAENESPLEGAAAAGAEEPRYQSFSQAIDTARQDAESKAREAAPQLKDALSGAAHDFTYGVAFGACFAVAFAREILPTGLKDALRKGAHDGRKAVAKLVDPAPESPAAAEVPA